jgi:transposase
MRIMGCDLHARQQTLAMLDATTGEVLEVTLQHEGDHVREFYSALPRPVRVGIEATGSMQWILNVTEELESNVWSKSSTDSRTPRKQRNGRRDADLILKLLMEGRFPAIWLPSKELQDLRSLLRHRHQWVRMRTRIQNALQSIALANGLRRGPALWSHDGQSRIASLSLAPHTAYRRSELQALYEKFEVEIEKLNQRVEQQACQRPGARLLMTHPGVGPVTALATEVFLGDPTRFADSNALASYVGMIPREYSSGGRQRLGGLSKQGNPLLRFLWGEAGAHAARKDPEWQRFYRRKLVQKGLGKASVAVARKLGIRLWVMLRDQIEYHEFCRRGQKQQKSSGACAGMPETPYGARRHRAVDEATRLPLGTGNSNNSSWSIVIEEMFGGQH